ncbi:MAG: SpoIIE family protein phosphatase [Flavobacteriales bacterium]
MNFKFTISKKISVGFGLFILVVAVVLFITTSTLRRSISFTREINEIHAPALLNLTALKINLGESLGLAENWVIIQSRKDARFKMDLAELISKDIPLNLQDIAQNSHNWSVEDQMLMEDVTQEVDNLFILFDEIMRYLPSFESYDDPLSKTNAEMLIEEKDRIDIVVKSLDLKLNSLISGQQEIISEKSQGIEDAFSSLLYKLIAIFIFALVTGIFIAHFTIKAIVKPVNLLKRVLLYLGKGVFPKHKIEPSNDEIGEMAFAVNRLVEGLKRTTEFASEVGKRNFNAIYKPLSEDDELGRELLQMRDDLAENERYLEQKVKERTDEVVRQKEEIESQNRKVTELYKDLTDSINYAKRLQQTILPGNDYIKSSFPESFVLFKPKSIVSGDFYWFKKTNGRVMFSVVDCTGHGVPGAFMSLVGYNSINTVTKIISRPSAILTQVDKMASETLQRRDDGQVNMQDGMDMAFCSIDPLTLELIFSGAHNPAYIVRGNELLELKPDKMAIGGYKEDYTQFSDVRFQLEPNDIIYLFSDGYADQFGGPNGKKFMKRKFKELLLEISHLPMEVQRKELYIRLLDWQGKEAQVDDICIFGVKITAESLV